MSLPDRAKRQLVTLKHIAELNISEEGLNDNDMAELVELIQRNNVKIDHLNLYRNNIRNAGAKFLAQLTDENVGLLGLSCCDITDEGAKALFRGKIKKIDIGDNNLTDESVDVFIREGKQTYLILNRNRKISQEKMLAANKKIEQNKREVETLKYSPPTPSLASTSFYGQAYRQTTKPVSNQAEISPFIETVLKDTK